MSTRQLSPLKPEDLLGNISQLWWDERTKVLMMNDKHITNALLKLQGLGKESYDGSPELRTAWISVLRLEQLKREDARKATLTKEASG